MRGNSRSALATRRKPPRGYIYIKNLREPDLPGSLFLLLKLRNDQISAIGRNRDRPTFARCDHSHAGSFPVLNNRHSA